VGPEVHQKIKTVGTCLQKEPNQIPQESDKTRSKKRKIEDQPESQIKPGTKGLKKKMGGGAPEKHLMWAPPLLGEVLKEKEKLWGRLSVGRRRGGGLGGKGRGGRSSGFHFPRGVQSVAGGAWEKKKGEEVKGRENKSGKEGGMLVGKIAQDYSGSCGHAERKQSDFKGENGKEGGRNQKRNDFVKEVTIVAGSAANTTGTEGWFCLGVTKKG